MRKQAFVPIDIIALIILFPTLAESRDAASCQSVRRSHSRSTVFITARASYSNGLQEELTGTGFIVHPSGYVLTCDHVVPSGPDYEAVQITGSVGGRFEHGYPLEIVKRDEDADLLLLKLPETRDSWQVVRPGNGTAEVGTSICILGFPLEEDLVSVPGVVTGFDSRGRLLTDAALNRGMSGGAVFDRKGVVGIAAAGYEAGHPLNVIIPISFAKSLLESIGDPPPQFQLGLVVGYRVVDTKPINVRHDTHPDDTLLPDVGIPGSAGTTSIRKGDWLFLGARLQKELQRSYFSLELLALAAPGDNETRKQNENDFRPPDEGSFIYSTANLGALSVLRYAYPLGRVKVGAEAQLSAIYIENGWERFGRREEADNGFEYLGSLGPMIGVRIGRDHWLESTYQFGDTRGFNALLVFTFW